MISLAPVADRLRDGGLPRVQGVLEYAAQDRPPAQLPATYVVPGDETPSPNRLSGVVDQRVSAELSVIIVVGAAAARADRPSEELQRLIRAAKDALIGWTIPSAAAPTEYAGGRLVTARGHVAAYALRFRTAYHERVDP